MKKATWYAAVIMVTGLLIGGWSMTAIGQAPPPPDEEEWMPGLGLGPEPGEPPSHGMGMGMGMRERLKDFARDQEGGRHGPGAKERGLERLKKEDPERYERMMKIKELAEEYREADSQKRKKEIEREIRPLVDKELKAQHEENKKRVEKLERKLEEMKKVLKQRDENWDQVVDHTVKEVTGQNAYLRAWRHGPKRK